MTDYKLPPEVLAAVARQMRESTELMWSSALFGTTTNAPKSTTATEIQFGIREAQRKMDEIQERIKPEMRNLEPRLAERIMYTGGPRHSKSANQGKKSYHRRIAKKWAKRFGRPPLVRPGQAIAMSIDFGSTPSRVAYIHPRDFYALPESKP